MIKKGWKKHSIVNVSWYYFLKILLKYLSLDFSLWYTTEKKIPISWCGCEVMKPMNLCFFSMLMFSKYVCTCLKHLRIQKFFIFTCIKHFFTTELTYSLTVPHIASTENGSSRYNRYDKLMRVYLKKKKKILLKRLHKSPGVLLCVTEGLGPCRMVPESQQQVGGDLVKPQKLPNPIIVSHQHRALHQELLLCHRRWENTQHCM